MYGVRAARRTEMYKMFDTTQQNRKKKSNMTEKDKQRNVLKNV